MKRLLALLGALALCLTLSGCWDPDTAPEPEDFWELEEPEDAVPEQSVKATRFTLPYLNSQTLDPIACSDGVQQVVGSLLYEGLFTLDERFVPQPALCASFTRSADGLVYTFTLREDAVFSDGSALTPADVLAAFRRAQVSDRYAARFKDVVSMRVTRSAFLLTLSRADAALPALLDIPIVKSGTEKNSVPLGTGPYCLVTDESGAGLVRNALWRGSDDALPERIELAPAKDADTAAYLFSAENAHLLTADLLSETAAAALGGVDITDAPTATMLFLGCNARRAPLDDAALRAAMSAAVDREAVVASLLAGHASAAQFPIAPSSPLYPAALEAPCSNDAYLAALTARGAADPDAPAEPLELTLLVNEENPFKTGVADYLARTLSAENVTVTPVALPWADYCAALERGDFDLWLGEVRLTADWDVSLLIGTGGALNYGGYSSAAADAALAAFLANEGEASAAALCELLSAEAPILPLVFKSLSVLTPEGRIDGLSPTAAQPLRGLTEQMLRFGA